MKQRTKCIIGEVFLGLIAVVVMCTVLFMSGCALMDTQTGDNKDIWTKVTIHNEGDGDVYIYPQTQVEKTEGDTTQKVDGEQKPTNRIDATVPVNFLKDGTGMIKDGLTGIKNSLIGEDILEPAPIIPEDTENKPEEDPVVKEGNSDLSEWKYQRTYHMQNIAHGRPFYRLGQPGENFGPEILITDNKGKKMHIPDTSKDTGNHSNNIFFNGGDKEHTFDGNASLFWYRDGAELITIYSGKKSPDSKK